MNRDITLEDTKTMIQAVNGNSEGLKIQEDAAIVEPAVQPHFQVFSMSSDDDFFWNHPNTAFAIFFGTTAIVLLVLMFVLWVG